MFDPLTSTPFADDSLSQPPWPTTPHPQGSPLPGLKRSPSAQSQSLDNPTASAASSGPYGREPQIYGKPENGLISPTANVGANGTKYERPEPYLRTRITLLDRNRRDILVRFDAQTNLPNFTGSTYRNISRSYAEFQQFYEVIIQNNPQTIIPALPLAQTSAPTDEEDDRLVRIMLQRWFTRVCEDQSLMRDEEMRSFIESNFGYQPMPRNPRKRSGSSFSLLKRGVPDEDEVLQRARFELTKLEGQFFDAAKALDKLARSQHAMSVAQVDLGNKLISLASTEVHPPLANALRKLGRALHTVSDLDQASAISERVIIGDSLGYQGLNAKSARETLQQRTSVLEEYQSAVKTGISKRRQIERLKASSTINPARVDEALEDMEEANKYEQILAQRVDGISHNLRLALERHNNLVEEDIITALIEHARTTISYERQRLRELEALRPDVKSADSKHVPTVTVASRPTYIPKLDEDLKSERKVRPSPAGSRNLPPVTADSFRPPAPIPPVKQQVPLPPQLQVAFNGSNTSNAQAPVDPLSSSSPIATNEPPLGVRTIDSGRPAAISLSASSSLPVSGAASGQLQTAQNGPGPKTTLSPTFVISTVASSGPPSLAPAPAPPRVYHEIDPLGPLGPNAPVHRAVIPDPLSASIGPGTHATPVGTNGQFQGRDVDPLGLATPRYMSQSLHLPPKPRQSRLDAREAASKLANMF